MIKITVIILFLLPLSSLSKTTEAHPVTFEDGIALSLINQAGMNIWHMNYSLSSSFAIGADYIRIGENDYGADQDTDMPLNDATSKLGLIRANFLVKRWLGRGSQGNLYLLGGIGGGKWRNPQMPTQSSLEWVGMLGIQADYETRRFYTALMARALSDQSFQIRHMPFHALYRVGVAPYLAKTHELQSWIVGQVSYHQDMNHLPNITLLMRFFIRTALWEIGADLEGRPWLHLMAHF